MLVQRQTATNIWNGSTFSSETAMSTGRGQGSHGNVGSSTSSTFAAGESQVQQQQKNLQVQEQQ
jgi:hypothetical protein